MSQYSLQKRIGKRLGQVPNVVFVEGMVEEDKVDTCSTTVARTNTSASPKRRPGAMTAP